ncbi:hypothetical protein C7999DRAFT_16047 [Corynascus novoguineensis]|uniref:Ubiquitin carrier protein n=1 Tax=Corynascus novoguineensis TaxID=1126955 RepID=A0AAN7HN67_9PEZI|nr:hypothetical protein C7999DRAFT_16047 [Corynascus novoguineensis]
MFTSAVGSALAKRLVENPPEERPPAIFVFLPIVNLVIFLPVFLILLYSLEQVYPTLAAVEDPLPAYEALPLNDDGTPKSDNTPVLTAEPGRPITASLRATNRLLRSLNGWLSNFRGLGYATLIAILTIITTLFLSLLPFVPGPVADLIALIAFSPLSTTWTHLVITRPTSKSFFQRIPPLKKVYLATWLPTLLVWVAVNATIFFPFLLARTIGLDLIDPENPDQGLSQLPRGSDAGKATAVLGLSLALQVLFYIPAHTALRRVQASLLPPDEDTLVPFDRSFAGLVEPEVVSGKGFATFGAALKTVTRASWARIYMLRVKVFAVAIAGYAAIVAAVVVEFLIVLMIRGQ